MNKILTAIVLCSAGLTFAASPSPVITTWSDEWYAQDNGHLANPATVAQTRTKDMHGFDRIFFRTKMTEHFTDGGCMADAVIIYNNGHQENLTEFFEDARHVPKIKIVEREGKITELPEALHKMIHASAVQVLDVSECSLTDVAREQLTKTWAEAGKKPEKLVCCKKEQ